MSDKQKRFILIIATVVALAALLITSFVLVQAYLHPSNNPVSAGPANNTNTSSAQSTSTSGTPKSQSNNPDSATSGQGSDQTTCPASGQARAANMPDVQDTPQDQLVFFTNAGKPELPANATFKRFDVRSGKTFSIISLPKTWIETAQISLDGKWLLFTGNVDGRSAMQIVRMDGQHLQTLFCAKTGESVTNWSAGGTTSIQWAPDQKHVILASGGPEGAPTLYLYTLANGRLDTLLQPAQPTRLGYLPQTWLDNFRVYMAGVIPNSDAPLQSLYLIDIRKGANQPESNLQKVIDSTNLTCWSFDSSYDASQLFMSQCQPKEGLGSGRIDLLSPTGGQPALVLNSTKLAITDIRTIGTGKATKLLLSVRNIYPGVGYDSSNDGLWLVNTDGSQLTRLTHGPALALNPFSQYSWANVSRDGNYVSVTNVSDPNNAAILYTTIDGNGNPFQIAAHDATTDDIRIVGWS